MSYSAHQLEFKLAAQQARIAFKEAKSDNGKPSLFISHDLATRARSKRRLRQNRLRFLTYQEALSRSEELIKLLDGRSFYLAGDGIHEKGTYLFDKSGKLSLTGIDESANRKVNIHPGKQQLVLGITPKGANTGWEARFELHGNIAPTYPATVVVGVRIDGKMERRKLKEFMRDSNEGLIESCRA